MTPKTGRYLLFAPALSTGLIFANLLLGLALAPVECGGSQAWLRSISLVVALLSIAVALAVYWNTHCAHRTERFVQGAGTLTALILGYALLLQTLSSLVLDACQR